MMRKLLFLSAVAGLLLGFGLAARADDSKLNTLTDKEKSTGWKLLFDGKTTDGWRAFKGKSVPDKWKVMDGTLTLKAKEKGHGGDIVTADQYDNFDFTFEWRVTPHANSGIMYRVSEEHGAPFITGPEYQILDNNGHPDGKHKETCAASCYAVYAPTKDMTKPVGEWNIGRILVNGNHVEHWLNGEKVVEYEFGSADWNHRIANSKFKEWSGFGKEKKGYIDLQDHGDEVAYRNLKIKVLKEE